MIQLGIGLGVGLLGTQVGITFGVGFAVGTFLAGLFFGGSEIEGPRLEDSAISGTALGQPIPEGHGTMRFTGRAIAAGPLVETSDTTKTGGLFGIGFLGGTKQTTFTYTKTIAFGIARAPSTSGWVQLLQVFTDKELIIDRTGNSTVPRKLGIQYTWYPGNETQIADADLEDLFGVGEVSAHRGLSYIVFPDFPISEFGNRIPSSFEFVLTENPGSIFNVDLFDFPSVFTNAVKNWTPDPFRDFVYAPLAKAAASTETGLVKIDKFSGTILTYNSDVYEGRTDGLGNRYDSGSLFVNPAVDKYGNLYWIRRNTVLRRLTKINPTTLTMVVESTNDTSGLNIASIRCNYSFTTPNYVALTASDAGLVQIHYAGEGLANTTLQALVNVTGATGECCWSSEGNLWTIVGTTLTRSSVTGLDIPNIQVTTLETNDLSSFAASYTHLTYWEDTNSIVLANITGSPLLIWDIDAQTGTASTTTWTANSNLDGSAFNNWIQNGKIGLPSTSNDFHVIDLVNDTEIILDGTDYTGVDIVHSDTFWESNYDKGWFEGAGANKDGRLHLPVFSGGGVSLKTILDRYSTRVGLAASEFDYTAQTAIVHGFRQERPIPARRAIEALQRGFLFDISMTDWKLVGVNRGGASSKTIPEIDLGASLKLDDKAIQKITPTRLPERELPLRFSTTFIDQNRQYQRNTEHDIRQTDVVSSTEEQSIDISVAMTADEALTLAAKWLAIFWAERPLEWSNTWEHLLLDPTDVITLTTTNKSYLSRITEYSWGANNLIKAKGVEVDNSVYGISRTSTTINDFVDSIISFIGQTKFLPADAPSLNNSQDQPGFVAGAAAASDSFTWPGAEISISLDGIGFNPWVTITNETTWGTIITDFPDHTGYGVRDFVNVPRVVLANGKTLTSTTWALTFAGANHALIIDSNGDAELIAFATATLVETGVYDLGGLTLPNGGLLRGQRGSNVFTGSHAVGATFVLLDDTKYLSVIENIVDDGKLKFYKAITFQQITATAEIIEFTNNNRVITPMTSRFIRGSRNGPNDLTIDFNPRSRFDSKSLFRDPPDDESTENYEVDVLDAPVGSVLRKITTTASANGSVVTAASQTALYHNLDQTADGITPGDLIDVKVYKISTRVLRGDGRENNI